MLGLDVAELQVELSLDWVLANFVAIGKPQRSSPSPSPLSPLPSRKGTRGNPPFMRYAVFQDFLEEQGIC